jgi:UDPglucose 6-dehydrogenase
MSTNICVVGTGYVGLIAAVGLSDFGNTVIAVDKNREKIDMLKNGKVPIYEPGIEEYLNRNTAAGRLRFSTDLSSAVLSSQVVFVAVGTPPLPSGDADLRFVFAACDEIAGAIRQKHEYTVLVTKSTVPVGTNRRIAEYLSSEHGLTQGVDYDVVSNPEFLREGRAVQDFFHPDRTVIGCESEKAREVMFEVYRALNLISVPFVWCNLETAELVKYASNAFLATKITFINEMANLADAAGADVHVVAKTMGMDGRISAKFLHPGPGYGGSCFPKDTEAIVATGDAYGVPMDLVRQVISSNQRQRQVILEKVMTLMRVLDAADLAGTRVAMLGLAFKQETDDVRVSPALEIAEKLIAAGCQVLAYDPKAMANAARRLPELGLAPDPYSAMDGADILILATEWNEFRNLDLRRCAELMPLPRIVDARNLLDPAQVLRHGIAYSGVGRGQESAAASRTLGKGIAGKA